MSSIRLDVRDAVIDTLNTDTPSDLPQATKRRWLPGTPLKEPSIAVFFNEEENRLPGGRTSGLAARRLQIAIQCADAVESPEEADDAMEAMLSWVVKALGDTQLGGLVSWTEELGTKWYVTVLDRVYVQAVVVFALYYQTARANMEKQA